MLQNVEEWEAEKSEADMEKYIWKNNISAKALASILKWTPDRFGKSVFHDPLPDEDLKAEHHAYGVAVKKVIEGMLIFKNFGLPKCVYFGLKRYLNPLFNFVFR